MLDHINLDDTWEGSATQRRARHNQSSPHEALRLHSWQGLKFGIILTWSTTCARYVASYSHESGWGVVRSVGRELRESTLVHDGSQSRRNVGRRLYEAQLVLPTPQLKELIDNGQASRRRLVRSRGGLAVRLRVAGLARVRQLNRPVRSPLHPAWRFCRRGGGGRGPVGTPKSAKSPADRADQPLHNKGESQAKASS